jgi:hypothetical protein
VFKQVVEYPKMSPKLARSNYFLRVLNESEATHNHWFQNSEPIAKRMYQLLIRLAEQIRDKVPITEQEIQDVNQIFHEYRAVRLQLSVEDKEKGDQYQPVHDYSQKIMFQAEIEDPDQGKRVYLEALISLFERLEDDSLKLRMCMECGSWYIPYNRAHVTKFCSSKCRNRFNYSARKEETFSCGLCHHDRHLSIFSGLILRNSEPDQITVGSVRDKSPICMTCTEFSTPERFQEYVNEITADHQSDELNKGGVRDNDIKILS